jgi:hypothetical protein
MAKKGRPKKTQSDNQAKTELKMLETIRSKEQEILYKDLAKLRSSILTGIQYVSDIDRSETIADAAFKAGRGYDYLNKASDLLENMLEDMYEGNDLDHYDDINDD